MSVQDQPVVIEMWTDLGCPWCYVGKHRDRVLLGGAGSVLRRRHQPVRDEHAGAGRRIGRAGR